jgi:propionate CoA-transferase
VLYVTERAVFELTETGVKLLEIAPGLILSAMCSPLWNFVSIVPDRLTVMDTRIFT